MYKVYFLVIVALFVGVGVVSADTTTSATATEVTATTTTTTPSPELDTLLKEMKVLRERIITLMIKDLSVVQKQSDKIALLQSMLSQDKEIYPEGVVTGTLGNLTKQAMVRYAKKNSINLSSSTDSILRGPARLMVEGAGKSGNVPPGIQKAPGLDKKLNPTENASTSQNNLKNFFRRLFK